MKPSVARIVHFVAPTYCTTPDTLEVYAAIITKVNGDGTVELTTFGPNSLYYQHAIPHSPEYRPGCWSWPPRVEGA